MLTRKAMAIAAVLLILAALGWGILTLMQLRFAGGDVYPEYSSFRADPLGTKVYFEALQQLPSIHAERQVTSPERLRDGRGATLFVIGLPWNELNAPDHEYRLLDSFVRTGGRLVVTLYPQFGRPRRWGTNSPAISPQGESQIRLEEKWGFELGIAEIKRGKDLLHHPVSARALATGMPATLAWHSALVFTNLSLDWTVVYARDSDAVMIERRLGAGTIVLATDSYFASNEALQKDRQPALLAWLAGPGQHVVFDEIHLGIHEQPGVAALARRYNLHGAFAALLLLATLFVWKNSTTFVPRNRAASETAEIRGRDSLAGFVNLLRRSTPRQQLLQTCLSEWHKSRQLDRRATPRKLEKLRALVAAHNAAGNSDPTATYNEITRLLNEK